LIGKFKGVKFSLKELNDWIFYGHTNCIILTIVLGLNIIYFQKIIPGNYVRFQTELFFH